MKIFENNNQNNKKTRNIFITVITCSLIFVLLTGILVGFFIGQKSKSDFLQPQTPTEDNIISNKYKSLYELEKQFKETFYKEITDEEIKHAYYQALFRIRNDKHTHVIPNGVFSSGSSEGGFGISGKIVADAIIKGFYIADIRSGTYAEQLVLEDFENAIYPGDVVVGYRNNEGSHFFNDMTGDDIEEQIIEKIQFQDDEKEKEKNFLVYNPIQQGVLLENQSINELSSHLRVVVAKYQKYKNNDKIVLYKEYGKGDLSSLNTNKKIAYMQINSFEVEEENSSEPKTYELTKKFLEKADAFLQDSSQNELLIDLRKNPGGNVVAIENVLKLFIKRTGIPQKLFALVPNAEKENPAADIQVYTSSEGTTVNRVYKIKVLVNQNTASAAEMFAVIMKEHCENCKIYGKTTYGKDVYQIVAQNGPNDVYSLGYETRITAGKWAYYKKNAPTLEDFHYITSKGFEIINEKDPLQVIENSFYNEQVVLEDKTFELDLVNLENSKFLSRFLTNYIKTYNYNNPSDTFFTSMPEYDETKLQDGTLIRSDGYFDLNVEKFLNKVKEKLGLLSDGLYDFKTYMKFYSYMTKLRSQSEFDNNNFLIKNYDSQLVEMINK